jgi:hypothetical protein
VFTWEVEVAQGSTCSGHDLLELLLLVVALVAGVIPVGVVVLVGGVKLLPQGTINDKVSGVTTLEATPGWSPPLLAEIVQGTELPCQQSNLIVGDALVLLIQSYSQRRQGKLQSRWDSVSGFRIKTTNMNTSNQSFTSKGSIMISMTFVR